MNRPVAVRDNIVPGWHALVVQLSAPQKVTQAYAGVQRVVSGTPTRAALPHSAKVTYIRSLLRLEGGQPTPKTVWKIAEVARACGKEFAWCAGPLLLFAAGHFDLFVTLILQVGGQVTRERRIALVNAAIGALRVTASADENSRVDAIKNANWSRNVKAKAIRQLQAQRCEAAVHLERKIWELKAEEWAAFEHLFRRMQRRKKAGNFLGRARIKSNAEFVASAAVLHPEAGLQQLRDVTVWATLSALAGKAVAQELARVTTGYSDRTSPPAKLHG